MKKKIKNREYILFTLLYISFCVYSIGRCVLNQKIITVGSDGMAQYYPTMCYIAKWIRDVVYNIFSGNMQIPLIDFTLGMGDDVLVTLNYYGFGDPFYLLSVFVNESGMPYFYTLLFFLRSYLGGMTFILLAKEIVPNKHSSAYVLSAIIYVCSGFTLIANMYFQFIHAYMYIPLLIYGTELFLKKGKKRLVVGTVFFFALSGFFFLYIGLLTSMVYVVFRFYILGEKFKNYCKKCVVWGISCLTGLLLSGFIFLPSVLGYLKCTRGQTVYVPLHYSFGKYKDMFFKLFYAKEANFQAFAFPIIAIVVITVLIFAEKHYGEKVMIAFCGIGFVLPAASYVMSGFGGIYDRWEIVLALVISLLVVKYWDEFLQLNKFQKAGVCNLYIIFLIIGYYEELLSNDGYYRNTLMTFSLVLFSLLVLSFVRERLKAEQFARWGMFGIAVISVFVQMNYNYRYEDVHYLDKQKVVEEILQGNQKKEFYRIDNEQIFNQEDFLLNLPFHQGYNGLGEYFSIISGDYVSALADWQVLSQNSYHSYGINHRTILETLCAVKYVILESGHEYLRPYGFEYINSTQDKIWDVYENKYSLPIGYTYTDVLEYDCYMELDGIEKQKAMLEMISLQNYEGNTQRANKEIWKYEKGQCDIISNEGIDISDEGVYIASPGDSLKLSIKLKAGHENYFMLEDHSCSIYLNYKDTSEFLEGTSVGTMGYSEQDEEIEIEVVFQQGTRFTPEQLVIGYLSMGEYGEAIQKLKRETLQNVNISANNINGTIEVDSDRILCMSIPYMEGWKAKLDGKKVEVYKANSMFMAIEVPRGEHTVEFSYCTPGLKLGGIISLSTLCVCLLYLFLRKRYCNISS